MNWTQLNFGKHEGSTLPQVLFKDPDWFYWAHVTQKLFDTRGHLKLEAEEAYRKSRNIKIPEGKMAEYVFDGMRGKFADLKLVDVDQPKHVGSSITFRKEKIDMFAVRETKFYDKLGNELLVLSLKSIVFGNANHRMTKQRCEAFFNNEANFIQA
ncbi:hypothetical protein A616_17095 [Brevibacillus brevis X23]|nr:hypothetical protein A616_17095 [Brevibacillus brevis X23]